MQLHQHDQIDIDYLHQDGIGGIIAQGLSVIFREQPKFPIDYLGKWLLSYSKNQQLQHQFVQKQGDKENLHQQHISELTQLESDHQQQQQIQMKHDQIEIDFKEKIQNHEYHLELLQKEFCDYLQDSKNLTGVYICQLDYQRREVDLDNTDDDLAHIKNTEPKLLHYVATSKDHTFLFDKILYPNQGVTHEFQKIQEEQNLLNLYIPDVVKDLRMFYHKWPKLGSYFAVPLTYHSCLSENSFDQGLQTRMQYLSQQNAQLNQVALKQAEFEQQMQTKRVAQEDTSEIEEEFQDFMDSLPELLDAPFLSIKQEFIVCMDTLGQDREISIKDREHLQSLIHFFSQSWEQREQHALLDSINQQIDYQNQQPGEIEEILEDHQRTEDSYVGEIIRNNNDYYNDLSQNNELQHTYELDCIRLTWMKDQLSDQAFNQPLIDLSKRRIIKFPGILQLALYLLGYEKEDINVPGTNVLNWRYIRTILDANLIDSILQYNHQGPKDQQLNTWCMVNRIEKNLLSYDQDAVDNYCLPYGRLYKILCTICRLRRSDIEVRRYNIQELRNQIIEIKQKIQEKQDQKEQALQEHLEGLTQEQRDTFVEEEWDQAFDLAKSPVPQQLDDPEDDIDADYNFI